jgi:hypothetical protein
MKGVMEGSSPCPSRVAGGVIRTKTGPAMNRCIPRRHGLPERMRPLTTSVIERRRRLHGQQ